MTNMRTMKSITITAALAALTSSAHAGPLADLQAKFVAMAGAQAPTIVLGTGTKVSIDGRAGGKVVSVFGDDACPVGFDVTPPGPGECITIDKPAVRVHFVDDGKVVTELWTVGKRGGAITLKRPDGTFIMSGT